MTRITLSQLHHSICSPIISIIFHLNIQSITPKMGIIKSEADAYDVLIFIESWLKPDISDTTIHIENFSQPFRNDRRNRLGGGVLAYVRETITCKRLHDLEINALEAVWLELSVKSKKVLVAGIYRPPNSNSAYMDLQQCNKRKCWSSRQHKHCRHYYCRRF